MKTSVTELGDSRVRVDVGIEPDAVQQRLERAARDLARGMRMPGFRKGKVPPRLVIQRVGREAVLEQALRDSLPEWYERALLDAGITPVGDPKLDVPSLPDAGENLSFSIEVAVRPKARLGEYRGLEVGRAEAEVPDDHRPESLAGKQASFAVTVKEVREKQLPGLDDEFAAEASEFETLDQLRDAIRVRIAAALEGRIDAEFREAAVDAAANAAQIELPEELVHARAHEMWDRLERSLAARGASAQTYLQMQGKTREEAVTDLESDAERALRREATLAAVAESEAIDVSDEEMVEALQPGEDGETPERLLERLRANGRDALLSEELRLRKAAEVIAGSARPIPQEQAAARDKLWTPDKEQAEGAEGGLWTPGADR